MKKPGFTFHPIGVIRSGHVDPARTPIQPVYAKGCRGRVEVLPEFAAGLRDIEGFSHILLVYCFHRAGAAELLVKPFLQDVKRGVFATRAPRRPNAIGISTVRLLGRDGAVLHVGDLDVLDGTPLLDIKPYVSRFDRIQVDGNGWQDEVDDATALRRGARQVSAEDIRGAKPSREGKAKQNKESSCPSKKGS